jgi:hypothetical protein
LARRLGRISLFLWFTRMTTDSRFPRRKFSLRCYPLATTLFIGVTVLCSAAAAQGQGAPGQVKQLQWWEIVSGIIAIPVSLISLAYSYALIKKTRIETRKAEVDIVKAQAEIEKTTFDVQKTQLEIIEKKKTLPEAALPFSAAFSELASTTASRVNEAQLVNLLILRFVVFSVTVSLISAVWNPLSQLTVAATFYLSSRFLNGMVDSEIRNIIVIGAQALLYVVYGAVIFVVGIPVLKDVNRYLGINFPGVRLKRRADADHD